MLIRPRHWLTALGLALVAHLGFAYWLQSWSSSPSGGARPSLSLSLAPAGSATTAIPTTTAPTPATVSPVAPEILKAIPPEITAMKAVNPTTKTAASPAKTTAKTTAKTMSKRLSEKPPRPVPKETSVKRRSSKSRNESAESLHRPVPSSAQDTKPMQMPTEKSSPSTDLSAVSDRRSSSQSKNTSANGTGIVSVSATPLPGNPKPPYPRIARSRGYEGRVVIQVFLTPAGTVARAIIEQSSGHGILDGAALRTVERWRFNPARRHDRPVGATLEIPITFRLQEG